MKIMGYQKVQTLDKSNIALIDDNSGAKTTMVTDFIKPLIGLTNSQDLVSGVSLSELTQINTLSADDKLLIGTAAGNKATGADDVLFAILGAFVSKEQCRIICRRKNLRNVIAKGRKANIKNGALRGFFFGNCWSIGSYTWRIMDFDYWHNCGGTIFIKPHLIIMPDKLLCNAQMNETNITTGSYVGSKMHKESLGQVEAPIASVSGNLTPTHREYLTNAVTDGYSSGSSWYDSTLGLLNEIVMYGPHVFAPSGNGTIIPNRYVISKTQLALSSVIPKLIPSHATFRLRDVIPSAYFALVNSSDAVDFGNASDFYGVHPIFVIGQSESGGPMPPRKPYASDNNLCYKIRRI